MRIPVRKYLFIGSRKAHAEFFEKAQKEGVMQFISVSGEKPHHLPKAIVELQQAISILRKQAVRLKEQYFEFSEVPDLVKKILEAKREIENCHEEVRLIKTEIVKVQPLGDFNLKEIEELKAETKKEIQFFFIRHGRLMAEEIPKDLIFLKREFDFDYYMYVGDHKFVSSLFTEINVTRSLSELKFDLNRFNALAHEKEQELKNFTAYQDSLTDYLFKEMNEINLTFAKNDVDMHLDQYLFAIEAWIPENKLDSVTRLLQGLPIYAEEVRTEEGDKIPTYLENKGLGKIGEDLLEIYDTPSITDKDPSPWMIWPFAIFFGMIIADAAYGMVFLLTSLFLWWKFSDAKGAKRRFLTLFTILSSVSIIWGVMVGSYFSVTFDPGHPLNRISLLYPLATHKVDYNMKHNTPLYKEWLQDFPKLAGVNNASEFMEKAVTEKNGTETFPVMAEMYDSILLEIALIVGILHLSLAFFRNLYRNWAGIGWIATMFGGFLYFPKVLDSITIVNYMNWMTPATSIFVGQQLLYYGMGVAILLSIIQSKWSGILSILKILEIFADTLSYLRLYALGLASLVLGATFNQIGMTYGGYAFGWLIILIGHIINISLAAGGGLIHGLRLHFLEWFHHCFEGEGYKFNPLRLLGRH